MSPENPFADSVPTHLAIAANVYTEPMLKLQEETKTEKSKLIFLVGGYGNGKSHALQRLKNDLNVAEGRKLAVYSSAFATRSLRKIYEQVCSDLLSGKLAKLDGGSENRILMETKGIDSKIIDLFFDGDNLKNAETLKDELQFAKTISSSSDVVSFMCGVASLVDQFVILLDDVEEAATMDKAERQAFLGYLRSLYDEAVRHELNLILIVAMTPDKLTALKTDRPDLYGRVDRSMELEKPTLKQMNEIVKKRMEITGLDNIKIDPDTLKQILEREENIRGILNTLRDLLNEAMDTGKALIKADFEKLERPIRKELPLGYKPADDVILKVLREQEGLGADQIIRRSGKSGSWIKHRLAEMVTKGILKKEQEARNKPAKYYLGEGAK